jgi:hypothetical protein
MLACAFLLGACAHDQPSHYGQDPNRIPSAELDPSDANGKILRAIGLPH